jgi:hypothetical protein
MQSVLYLFGDLHLNVVLIQHMKSESRKTPGARWNPRSSHAIRPLSARTSFARVFFTVMLPQNIAA